MITPRFDNHVHTEFSNTRLLDSINQVSSLVDYAIEIGLKGLAITDHGNVCGWIQANQKQLELQKQGIDFKIALGEEGYLTDVRESGIKYYHCLWIAKDKIGAKQIRRMSSIANLNSYFDRGMERVPLLKSELEMIVREDPGHIIVTSACLGGELSSNILSMENARKIGDVRTAQECHDNIVRFVLWMKDLFKDDFYFEVAPSADKDQIIVNKKMAELAQVFGIKIVIGSDAHYLKKEDRYVHEAFLNSKGGERETAQFYSYAYLQTEEEIKENLSHSIVDLYDWMCANSMEMYNKIETFSLAHPQQIPQVDVVDYPKKKNPLDNKYTRLNKMYSSEDKIERYWVNRCIDKLNELGKNSEEYIDELEEEAEVKKIVGDRLQTNMYAYPVTLAHYVDMFWALGSTIGAGRGSACSALNHYALGITQLDPLEWDFPFFRYMNRDTDGLGDIDIDLAPSKIPLILQEIKKERGAKFDPRLNLTDVEKENLGAVYVCTYGTESSKSAILTSFRGYRSQDYQEGIDNDTAQYVSSLIPSERGFVWSIHDAYYGNKEKDRKPISAFVNEIDKYPGLLEILLGVEGLLSRKGRHASGVLFLDEDPYEFNAYMKTPSGEVVTQWDLHGAEWAGSTKFDMLVTEIQDKIIKTIEFLQENGEIEKDLSLREAYDKYLHPDVLPYETDLETWDVIQRAGSLDLFQLDSEIGRLGATKVKPTSMIELSATNGLIRLMTAEKGEETWLDKYCRYKRDKREYEKDIEKYHLTEEERKALKKYVGMTCGIGVSQEQFMKTLMDPDICNFSLKDANKARKIISKKKMSEIPTLKEQIFSSAKSHRLAEYVWAYVASPGLGYSFSDIHSISYSFIGFQSAYLATHWNAIYWDTACLAVNSGSLEDSEKGTDYSKVANAIAAIRNHNINVSLVNINISAYGFEPDVKNNRILYGLKGLANINSETIEKIYTGRPYSGIKDFMNRCPLTKTAMISLIKAGAFDEVDEYFNHDRKLIMAYYIWNNCNTKQKLNLQNFNGLVQANLIPKELELQIRVFNFNKYLKNKKYQDSYLFDDTCLTFFEKFFSDYMEELWIIDGKTGIPQKSWDKIYKAEMDNVRTWLKDNQETILDKYNKQLFVDMWEKYCLGTLSHWEMESMSFYWHPHELANVKNHKYGLSNFSELKDQEVDYFFKRNGREIPIYKLYRIAGTVLSKNDTRHSISLLTTEGVVNVKFTNEYYGMFKKQISQIQPDGTKKVLEKGWFGKGTLLMIQGYKRENTFVAKSYSNSEFHQLYKITNVTKDGEIVIQHDRVTGGDTEEDDYE